MSRNKRPWGVVAGPMILVLGLAAFWTVRSALDVRDRVADWSDRLEHSAEPVVMEMPRIPLIPPLYVNSQRIGRIEEVVVDRVRPRGIDSVRILAKVADQHLGSFNGCSLRLRVSSFDMDGYTRALRCTRDVENLVPFGHLAVEGTDLQVPIMVQLDDLPCDETGIHVDPCSKVSDRLRAELAQVERDLHQVRLELRRSAREVRRDVRAAVRSIR